MHFYYMLQLHRFRMLHLHWNMLHVHCGVQRVHCGMQRVHSGMQRAVFACNFLCNFLGEQYVFRVIRGR
jgi:hypothetical protein